MTKDELFSEKKFVSKKHESEYLDFLEYVPRENGNKKPLLIYIHGAGSKGDHLSKIAFAGPIKELANGREIDAVTVVPQCHAETWFDLFEVLCEFISECIKRSDVDKDRVYLTGPSMGGYTVWQLCMSHPEWFAAAVPICGGGMYWNAARLKELPIWAFHGACDTVVLPEESVKMVSKINASGGDAKITVFSHNGHNAWDDAYASDEMWKWMFEQKKELRNVTF